MENSNFKITLLVIKLFIFKLNFVYFYKFINKINGNKVASTKSYKLSWPIVDINIMEKFELHLFSKPESI